jgi:archaellum component FlaF (FlaF/FlaG flagellin family)
VAQENVGADAVLGAVAGVAGGAVAGAVSALRAANSVMDRVTMGLASGGTQKFHVDKDTVLQAGKVVHDQWQLLSNAYDDTINKLRIKTADGVVTSDVVNAWNDRLVFHDDSYANRINDYMKVLQSLSDQLRESAQQYGFTDDEISASFGPKA